MIKLQKILVLQLMDPQSPAVQSMFQHECFDIRFRPWALSIATELNYKYFWLNWWNGYLAKSDSPVVVTVLDHTELVRWMARYWTSVAAIQHENTI